MFGKEYYELSDDDKKKANETSKEFYLEIMFLHNSDKKIYGKLLE